MEIYSVSRKIIGPTIKFSYSFILIFQITTFNEYKFIFIKIVIISAFRIRFHVDFVKIVSHFPFQERDNLFMALMVFHFVSDPKVIIIDEEGSALQDKYYEVDSTLQLSCIVRNVKMTSTVFWSHGDRILNYDVDRGGIK